MNSFIFVIAVGLLGFLFGDGAFGSKLINAFEYINILYWIVFILVIILVTILIFGITSASTIKWKLRGFIGGGIFGIFLSFLILLVPAIQLILIHNIILTTDPNVIDFQSITDKTYIYLWLLISILSSSFPFKGNK